MDKSILNLIDPICLEFEFSSEFKLFFQILKKYFEDPSIEPLISYTDFQTICNITNRNVVKRGIYNLIDKDYIVRKEEGNTFSYKPSQKVIDLIKK